MTETVSVPNGSRGFVISGGGTMPSNPKIEVADLKEREEQVLSLLVLGYKVRDMATTLNISTNYVYLLIRSLRQRFLAKTNAAVVSRAIAEGVVSADGVLAKESKTRVRVSEESKGENSVD